MTRPPAGARLARWAARVHDAFHVPSTRDFQVTTQVVGALVALSVALLLVEILLPAAWRGWIKVVDRAILVVFAAEFLLRVGSYVPPRLRVQALTPTQRLAVHVTGRLRYCAQPLVLVDLVTLLGAHPGLRGLRAVRLLRLLRSPRLLKYANPFEGIARALEENAILYAFGGSVFLATVLVGAIGFYLSEHGANPAAEHLSDAVWWSVVTVTTVGYGDLVPKTDTGRLIAAALMVSGMITLALFAGIVSSSLMSTVISLRVEAFRMSDTLGHVVVCGYEPGSQLLLDALLAELGDQRRIVLFGPRERPTDVPPEFQWLEGDPTKESELDKVRLGDADALIVVGSRSELPQTADARTILAIFTARRYLRAHEGRRLRPVYVVAEILDSENVDHARTAGANEVVETRRIGFHLLAHSVREPGTATLLGELADVAHHSVHVGVVSRPAPYRDLVARLLLEHGVTVIGVRDASGRDHIAPPGDRWVDASDEVLYIATAAVLER